MKQIKTPQQWHEKQRFGNWPRHKEDDWQDCPQCQRQVRICKGKKKHASVEEAWDACLALNERENYKLAAVPYYCRYCEQYHKKTAVSAGDRRRMAKQRTKFVMRDYVPDPGRRRVLP